MLHKCKGKQSGNEEGDGIIAEQTVNEIAAKYELSPVMISRWKAEFIERASMVFEKKTSEVDKMKKEYESKQEHLEKLVGQLTVEVDWLKKKSGLK